MHGSDRIIKEKKADSILRTKKAQTKKNSKKSFFIRLIYIVLVILLILNMILFALRKTNDLIFWFVILFSFILMQILKKH